MNRQRATLLVEVDLDPVPGWGNFPEDWQLMLQHHLDAIAPHYHPTVTVHDKQPLARTDVCPWHPDSIEAADRADTARQVRAGRPTLGRTP